MDQRVAPLAPNDQVSAVVYSDSQLLVVGNSQFLYAHVAVQEDVNRVQGWSRCDHLENSSLSSSSSLLPFLAFDSFLTGSVTGLSSRFGSSAAETSVASIRSSV